MRQISTTKDIYSGEMLLFLLCLFSLLILFSLLSLLSLQRPLLPPPARSPPPYWKLICEKNKERGRGTAIIYGLIRIKRNYIGYIKAVLLSLKTNWRKNEAQYSMAYSATMLQSCLINKSGVKITTHWHPKWRHDAMIISAEKEALSIYYGPWCFANIPWATTPFWIHGSLLWCR